MDFLEDALEGASDIMEYNIANDDKDDHEFIDDSDGIEDGFEFDDESEDGEF